MAEFRMPSLGSDMEAGTLVEWLKKPGDAVKRGDIVAVVDTQKGAIEIEIFEDGVIDRILVEPGRKVPVGTPLAMVRGEGEPPSPAPAPAPAAAPAAAAAPPSAKPAPPPPKPASRPLPPTPAEGRLRISPAAAVRALALGVDPKTLTGTGPGGAIRIADVEAAAAGATTAAAPSPAAAPEPPDPAKAMRAAIAAAMSRANREIPHYYLAQTIDMSAAMAWLTATNENRPVTGRLLYGVLLLKAVALALRDYPEFNGFWENDAFRPGAGIHVGSAIALRGGGLVAPAVHDADAMSLDDLMAALRDLVKRARAMRLRSSEMSDATITVTSLGEQGVETVFGVIYPPQVALVGFGILTDRSVAADGKVVVRPVIHASLAGDHRASDGHRGARFLAAIDKLLQQPEVL